MVDLPGAQLYRSPKHSPLQSQCLPCLCFSRRICELGALYVLAPALAAPLPGCGLAWPGLGGKLQACRDLPCPSDMVPACMTPPHVGATLLGAMDGHRA